MATAATAEMLLFFGSGAEDRRTMFKSVGKTTVGTIC